MESKPLQASISGLNQLPFAPIWEWRSFSKAGGVLLSDESDSMERPGQVGCTAPPREAKYLLGPWIEDGVKVQGDLDL